MTSSLKRITSRLSLFWTEKPEWAFSIALFAIVLIHGSLLGLTDDEAYYWVLAQKPALSYAFHPPAVAWLIAISQKILGGILGDHSAATVRLPAAFCIAATTGIALRWLRWIGVSSSRLIGAALVLSSFAGVYSLSWMMVPDLPLILGWTIAFASTWAILRWRPSSRHFVALGFGVALSILSKYSGVLVAGSAGLAVLIWAKPSLRIRAIAAITVGAALALVPLIVWNSQHEWASILYQIRDRHEGGGGISFTRYGRFWAVESLAAGPFLLIFGFGLLRKVGGKLADPIAQYVWIWALPAVLVFGLQPLWADFKPHWALIGWWPFAIAFAYAWAVRSPSAPFARAQAVYGLVLGAIVMASCHWPLGSFLFRDPLLDVTNDLYGWKKLPAALRSEPSLPVIGSRYQTASQAYFALGPGAQVTLLPRDLKSMDEWPNLGVTDTQGPEWPRLLRPVLFVSDNRYDLAPAFVGATCKPESRLEESRGNRVAKWIQLWKCSPTGADPAPIVSSSP